MENDTIIIAHNIIDIQCQLDDIVEEKTGEEIDDSIYRIINRLLIDLSLYLVVRCENLLDNQQIGE
jgi:hypothetical protein